MASIEEFLADVPDPAAAMFERFRGLALAAGDDVEERVHRTEVAWAVKRVFAVAFILRGRLEVAIDLLRAVEHEQLHQAFPTTARVVTNRLTFSSLDQLDETVAELLQEAHDRVGPGTR